MFSLYKKIVATQFEIEPVAGYPWDKLDFSVRDTDWVVIDRITTGDSAWAGRQLVKSRVIQIDLASTVLNYGQGIFEGVKVERDAQGNIIIFRLRDNAERMIKGAGRLCCEPYPIDQFIDAIKLAVRANARWVPPHGMGSLYIRPMLFGSGEKLGVAPAPAYTFAVWTSPVGLYWGTGGVKPIAILVTHDYHRATPGGVGGVKAIDNYAPSMEPAKKAKAREAAPGVKYNEVLYLDVTNTYAEEVGAMNIFAVKDGIIYTPELSGTILPGITRDSVIKLAREMGYKVIEGKIPIDFIMTADEFFGTGTAAVVSPVGILTNKQLFSPRVPYFINKIITTIVRTLLPKKWYEKLLKEFTTVFSNNEIGPITARLLKALTGIKEGRDTDPYDWVEVVVRARKKEEKKQD